MAHVHESEPGLSPGMPRAPSWACPSGSRWPTCGRWCSPTPTPRGRRRRMPRCPSRRGGGGWCSASVDAGTRVTGSSGCGSTRAGWTGWWARRARRRECARGVVVGGWRASRRISSSGCCRRFLCDSGWCRSRSPSRGSWRGVLSSCGRCWRRCPGPCGSTCGQAPVCPMASPAWWRSCRDPTLRPWSSSGCKRTSSP